MRIGIVGAGQLGRMLALAGRGLGQEFVFLDPAKKPCAAALGEHWCAPFADVEQLTHLAAYCDVVTYEFENVPAAGLDALDRGDARVYPPPRALSISQDRRREKSFFESLNIAVAPWAAADSAASLAAALEQLDRPLIVKTATLGYDGKGQRRLETRCDAASLFAELGEVALCVEAVVDFDYEVSIIGTRTAAGEITTYPLCRNKHVGGILNQTCVDPDRHELQATADNMFERVAQALDYVGTLTIELFVCGKQLVANEFAPRVHNSGHWTLGGAETCQFENHLRAVSGLPLGPTMPLGWIGMQNFVGALPSAEAALRAGASNFQNYQKTPRPGRKVGHATVVADSASSRESVLNRLNALPGWQV